MTQQVSLQYCPRCGTPFAGIIICSQCGFDQTKTTSKADQPDENDEIQTANKIWPKISKIMYWVGTYAWIITTLITLIFFIIGIFRLCESDNG